MLETGNVGGRLATMCRTASKSACWPMFLSADQIKARGAEKVELDELLVRSDYVSVHCPLTKQTAR